MSFQGRVVERQAAGGLTRGARALGLALVLVCALFPAVAVAAPNDTIVSSRSSGEGPPDALHDEGEACGICAPKTGNPVISGDGRYVAFWSSTHNLVPGDRTIGRRDIFLRDHGSSPPTTTLISRASDPAAGVPGSQAEGDSAPSAMSADGRFVVFDSLAANLVANDVSANGASRYNDVFLRDLKTGTTTLVSATAGDGRPANNRSYNGVTSSDGRHVAFYSESPALVAGDTNGQGDVFVRDMQTNTTRVVSSATGSSVPAGDVGDKISISADGRYVTFTGGANLVDGAAGGVFIRDRDPDEDRVFGEDNETTTHVSAGFQPSLSSDGRWLAFSAQSPDRVVVRDLQMNTTTLVSAASDGTASSGSAPSISGDGRFVAFSSFATNFGAPDGASHNDVFVRDIREGKTALVSRASGQDGELGNKHSHTPAMAAGGGFVAFASQATNLVANDRNGLTDVFRRELAPPPPPLPPLPSASISDVTVTEGDVGEVDARLTVSLSTPSNGSVTIDFATGNAPSTADAGPAFAPDDYAQTTGTLSFATGVSSRTVTVKVKGDRVVEPAERFQVELSKPTGAAITRKQGFVTILDDDDPAAEPALGTWAATSGARLPHDLRGNRMDDAVLLTGPACRGGSPASYCGKVLIAGWGKTTELYDPANNSWSASEASGNLKVDRRGATLTLLDGPECRGGASALPVPGYCGKVLLVGGTEPAGGGTLPAGMSPPTDPGAAVELYDPATGRWSSCESAATASADCPAPYSGGTVHQHSATLLADGRVLIAGGRANNIDTTVIYGRQDFYVYNPAVGRWGEPHALYTRRTQHRAVLLQGGSDKCGTNCGKVLLVGGRGSIGDRTGQAVELVDPVAGVSVGAPEQITSRPEGHSATQLSDGRVLVAGGGQPGGTSHRAEYFDPKAVLGAWSAAPSLRAPRSGHTTTLLETGRLLIAGDGGERRAPAELYDPASGSSSFTGPSPSSPQTATLLPHGPRGVCATSCGKVLVTDRSGGAYLYTLRPEVTKLSSADGPSAGGTAVTIEGRGLASVTSVHFGAHEATSLTPDPESPDIKLVAVSPPQPAGTVPVTVTSSGGNSASSQSTQFIYIADPADPAGTAPEPGPGTGDGAAPSATATTPAGAAQVGVPLVSVTTPAGGGPQQGAAPPAITNAAQARRARALRSCLARVARHATSERAATRRGSPGRRARAKRHLARHQSSAKRGCLARHGLTPGPVARFSVRATSPTAIQLSFSAAGSDTSRPPAARRYVVKQSLRPIRNASDFRRAQTLCAGDCRFAPQRIGERLELTVTDLRRRTTYYYAIAARDDITPRLGPRSRTISVRTR